MVCFHHDPYVCISQLEIFLVSSYQSKSADPLTASVPHYLFRDVCLSQSQDMMRLMEHLGFQVERNARSQHCASVESALEQVLL